MIIKGISNADVRAINLLQGSRALTGVTEQFKLGREGESLQINFDVYRFTGATLTVMNSTATEDSILHTRDDSAAFSVNFQLHGKVNTVHSAYQSSGFKINSGQHNLFYSSKGSGEHNFLKGNACAVNLRIEPTWFHDLFFDESMTEQLVERSMHETAFFANPTMMNFTAGMNVALKDVINCPLEGTFKKVFLEAKMLELLALQMDQLIHFKKIVSLTATDINKIHALRDYLDTHYLLPHSLLQLAKSFGLNDYKLKKGFRDLYRTTVFGYINEKKMMLSAKLLRERSLPVNEIADMLGYQHATHFSAAFKRYYGTSPSGFSRTT